MLAYDFTEFSAKGSHSQYSSTGSDKGLVPKRRQAIIWTRGGLVYWRIYASLGLNELTEQIKITVQYVAQNGAYFC